MAGDEVDFRGARRGFVVQGAALAGRCGSPLGARHLCSQPANTHLVGWVRQKQRSHPSRLQAPGSRQPSGPGFLLVESLMHTNGLAAMLTFSKNDVEGKTLANSLLLLCHAANTGYHAMPVEPKPNTPRRKRCRLHARYVQCANRKCGRKSMYYGNREKEGYSGRR